MRTKAGVKEIHARGFDGSFQRIAEIWLYQDNNAGGYEQRQPPFSRRRGDVGFPCHRLIIQHTTAARGGYAEKTVKGILIRDLRQIPDVSLQIALYV